MSKKKKAQYVALSLSKIVRTMSEMKEYTIQANAPVKFDRLLVSVIASLEKMEEFNSDKNNKNSSQIIER